MGTKLHLYKDHLIVWQFIFLQLNQIERLKVRLRVMQFMGNFEEDMNIIVPVSFWDFCVCMGGGRGRGVFFTFFVVFFNVYSIFSASGCCHSCIEISHFFTVLQKSARGTRNLNFVHTYTFQPISDCITCIYHVHRLFWPLVTIWTAVREVESMDSSYSHWTL